MKNLVELMGVYHHHHTKTITKLTHFIGVPSIIFSLEILLSLPHFFSVPISWIAVVVLIVYYLSLNVNLGVITGLFFVSSNVVAVFISESSLNFAIEISIFAFVFGWILQLVGHYFEGKRPALMSNFFQVFVAPIFLVAEVFFMFGYMRELQKRVASTMV